MNRRIRARELTPEEETSLRNVRPSPSLGELYQNHQDLMDDDGGEGQEVEEHDDDPASRLPDYPFGRNLTNSRERRSHIQRSIGIGNIPAPPSTLQGVASFEMPVFGGSDATSRMSYSGPEHFRPLFRVFQHLVSQMTQQEEEEETPPPVVRVPTPPLPPETKAQDMDPDHTKIKDILSRCLDTCNVCECWDVPGLMYLHDQYRPQAPGNNLLCKNKICMACYTEWQKTHQEVSSTSNLRMTLCPFCRQRIYLLPMTEESRQETRIAWALIAPPSSVLDYTSCHLSRSIGLDIHRDKCKVGDFMYEIVPILAPDQPSTQKSISYIEPKDTHTRVSDFHSLFRHFVEHMSHCKEDNLQLVVKIIYYYLIQLRSCIKEDLDEILEKNKHKDPTVVEFIYSKSVLHELVDSQSPSDERYMDRVWEQYKRLVSHGTPICRYEREEEEEESALPIQSLESSEVLEEEEDEPDRILYEGEWYEAKRLESLYVGEPYPPFPLHSTDLCPVVLLNRHAHEDIDLFCSSINCSLEQDQHTRMFTAMHESYQTSNPDRCEQEKLPLYSSMEPLLQYFVFWMYECFENRASINEWRLPLRYLYQKCYQSYPKYRASLCIMYGNLFYGDTYHKYFYRLIVGKGAHLFDYFIVLLSGGTYEIIMMYLECCHFLSVGVVSQVVERSVLWTKVQEASQKEGLSELEQQCLSALLTKPEELYT